MIDFILNCSMGLAQSFTHSFSTDILHMSFTFMPVRHNMSSNCIMSSHLYCVNRGTLK